MAEHKAKISRNGWESNEMLLAGANSNLEEQLHLGSNAGQRNPPG